MSTNRWLKWKPNESILDETAQSEPTKPSEPGNDGFVGAFCGKPVRFLSRQLPVRPIRFPPPLSECTHFQSPLWVVA